MNTSLQLTCARRAGRKPHGPGRAPSAPGVSPGLLPAAPPAAAPHSYELLTGAGALRLSVMSRLRTAGLHDGFLLPGPSVLRLLWVPFYSLAKSAVGPGTRLPPCEGKMAGRGPRTTGSGAMHSGDSCHLGQGGLCALGHFLSPQGNTTRTSGMEQRRFCGYLSS